MKTLAIICGLLLVALPCTAQSKNDQDKSQDKSTDKAQIVGTAEITKVDAKKKTLQVRNTVEGTNDTASPNRTGAGRRGGGGGGGGGYPGGGGRYPGGGYPGGGRRPGGGYPGGGGRYPGGGGNPGGGNTNQVKEYKVFITKDTVLKLEDQDAEFSDFHVGDRVVVTGTPRGSSGDLDATTVTRKF